MKKILSFSDVCLSENILLHNSSKIRTLVHFVDFENLVCHINGICSSVLEEVIYEMILFLLEIFRHACYLYYVSYSFEFSHMHYFCY